MKEIEEPQEAWRVTQYDIHFIWSIDQAQPLILR